MFILPGHFRSDQEHAATEFYITHTPLHAKHRRFLYVIPYVVLKIFLWHCFITTMSSVATPENMGKCGAMKSCVVRSRPTACSCAQPSPPRTPSPRLATLPTPSPCTYSLTIPPHHISLSFRYIPTHHQYAYLALNIPPYRVSFIQYAHTLLTIRIHHHCAATTSPYLASPYLASPYHVSPYLYTTQRHRVSFIQTHTSIQLTVTACRPHHTTQSDLCSLQIFAILNMASVRTNLAKSRQRIFIHSNSLGYLRRQHAHTNPST